jgi:hypothetical protein
MKPSDRARLTNDLQGYVARIAADLRTGMLVPDTTTQQAARRLHADERVGEEYTVWTDLLSRRAAVLWVLKSVYVRVLEDRGLVNPGRLLDEEAQQLFEQLAPNLGETAFLRWIYRDLASRDGGLPELFGTQPAELALPSDDLSRALIAYWRHQDPDTGARWSFAEEHFEGELMGDLYQELDPVVKARYALCQTPDFVRAFMLDRTLTPAIESFGADQVRLLDPACGSGHLLIDGLKRLFQATQAQHPDWPLGQVALQVLERVVGIDINDYACGLARTRLVMTAAELAGVNSLAESGQFHPQIYWADGLEQVERDGNPAPQQPALFVGQEGKVRASFTRSDVRKALRKVFQPKFHAVVANPPYITEKDPVRKDYHRERVGANQRYITAYREYSLASPFTERCFQLALQGGYVGLIVSNNFMKREFGKPLIERVLASLDLTLVVDTSQAYIPFHGTPTVMLFGRNQNPVFQQIRAVMGKRGESGVPEEPAQGRVWSSIVEGWDQPGFENEYVSVAELSREILGRHPWSLGGGGAAKLRTTLEGQAARTIGQIADSIGFGAITGADEVFVQPKSVLVMHRVENCRPMITGDVLRNWGLSTSDYTVWPNDSNANPLPDAQAVDAIRFFWPYRAVLRDRRVFSRPIEERGIKWWQVREVYTDRFRTPLTIAFAFVATHNHFVLDRGGKVFNRSAPVIKLPPDATEDDHLALLGLLNSSTACFWMKQVFHNKGASSGDTIRRENWEPFIEFDSTKMKLFPVVAIPARVIPYARRLDALARTRADRSVASILGDLEPRAETSTLKAALEARRCADLADFMMMVSLQEELDWLCYNLYGLDESTDVILPDQVEPMLPTALPWLLTLAEKDRDVRAALARGESTEDLPTDWFPRHGWDPIIEVPPSLTPFTRRRIQARRDRTQVTPALALIETANFKRRWYRPDYEAEEQEALRLWLADRVEAEAKTFNRTFNLEQMVAALQDDTRVLAICEVLTGRRDFSLSLLVGEALQGDAVPSHRFHLYKPSGLLKREVWERTWADQRREDAGEAVAPQVPPAYELKDFLRIEYWQLRGKLDVPKERFIAFTEMPGNASEPRYGWAGWTPIQRVRALLALDEDLDDQGIPVEDRIGLLDSAWRLLPEAAQEDAAATSRLKGELQALVGLDGPSAQRLQAWQLRFPPPRSRAGRSPRTHSAIPEHQEND